MLKIGRFLEPDKNLVRWDWQFRFDEINGVGVTIKQGWIRGYRGSEEKVNKREAINYKDRTILFQIYRYPSSAIWH